MENFSEIDKRSVTFIRNDKVKRQSLDSGDSLTLAVLIVQILLLARVA